MKTLAKVTIEAGGAWEGHVFFRVTDPNKKETAGSFGTLGAAISYAEQQGLEIDPALIDLVKKHLVYSHETSSLIIPPEVIDEMRPISSAQQYLRSKFPDFY